MRLHTCSQAISLSRNLENESGRMYANMAEKRAEHKETLLSFAKENAKNVIQIERAYYGVITDAIEGCFAFDMEEDDYAIDTASALKANYADALNKALKIEEKIVKFYTEAAEQSKSLMADVPRTFTMVAKKRATRIAQLKSLL